MDPTVIENISLLDFIQYLLHNHAPNSLLIICASYSVFLHQLSSSITSFPDASQVLLTPTLHLLAASRTLQVAFCASLQSLQAYLSACDASQEPPAEFADARAEDGAAKTPILAVLNLLSVHRDTAAWSAQGLSRTFAAAVETARRTRRRLLLVECSAVDGSADDDDAALELDHGEEAETGEGEDGSGAVEAARRSVWDEQVAILNVTTRSFGAGERGWVGRTVKVRQIAERWCRFERHNTPVPDLDDEDKALSQD